MPNKLRRMILCVLACVSSYYIILAPGVYADSQLNDKPIHLQISPVKQKLKLERGQSKMSSIKVRNIGTEKFTYNVSVSPYSVRDEKYNADYEDVEKSYTKMPNWIKIDDKLKTGILEPNEEVEVPFTITVPSDMYPGGQYAAIMAETSDGNSEGSVIKTINRLGMILYADIIDGSIDIDGEVLNNNVSSFILEPPLTDSSTVENKGNYETTATYTVKIWPFGSSETIFSNEESPMKLDIIPGTRRYNAISWDEAPRLGIFTVEQTVEYPNKEPSVVKKMVIICPFWLIVLFSIICIVLITWLALRIVKRRKNGNSKERVI